jgi:predicted Zn-dependent peptidase
MYKISKLKNGITLIKVPVAGTKALTIMAMFPVGSRYEEKELSGCSHFVEHMMFKGTVRRPTHLEISRELDAFGAEYNAFTSKDYTGYYVKTGEVNMEKAFDWLSDVIFNSKFEAEEVEKEKGVIIEEMRMYEDNPIMAVDDMFERQIFGADHPLGRYIVGNEATLRAMTREGLWQYYKDHYYPGNMVLVVAGNINEKKLRASLKYFLAIDHTVYGKKNKKTLKDVFEKFTWNTKALPLSERVVVSERAIDQVQTILGFPGLAQNDSDRFALSVLLNILGGGMSSRLFVEVREKQGLAYTVSAGAGHFRDVGVVTVQAGLDKARFGMAIQVIKNELKKIKEQGVLPKELLDAKNNIAGRRELAMENSSVQAEWFAKQFWFNKKIQTYEQVVAKIKQVTAADVKRVANKIFAFDRMHIAVIGPMNKEKVLDLLK